MESTKTNKKTKIKEMKISAGSMPLKDGKIKPDPAKGEIYIFEKDGMLIFQWTNLDKNISEEPLVVFSGEWEWTKIPSNKGRVYVMKSKCFEDAQYYFWMQCPQKDKDEENERIINQIFEDGNFNCLNKNNKEEKEEKNEITGINNFVEQNKNLINPSNTQFNNINTINNNQNEQNMKNEDFIKNLATTFKNIKRNF